MTNGLTITPRRIHPTDNLADICASEAILHEDPSIDETAPIYSELFAQARRAAKETAQTFAVTDWQFDDPQTAQDEAYAAAILAIRRRVREHTSPLNLDWISETFPNMPRFVFNDGGRGDDGYKGLTGDCGIRAVAIALNHQYKPTCKALIKMSRNWEGRSRLAECIRTKSSSTRGIYREVVDAYMTQHGWERVKEKAKINAPRFNTGRFLVSIRKHFAVIQDHEYHDTYDSRITSGHYAPQTPVTAFSHWRPKR